jgi:YidC/Oxa1 family membrane protein insertase
MWLTKRLNNTGLKSEADQQTQASMKIMDIVMPLMTLFFAFNFSGMLGLYWVYQSILGIGQSLILAKAMPLPKFTEEDIKKLNKEKKEAEKAQKEALKAQPKHKSLHYIDEDDYEELPEVKTTTEDKKPDISKGDIPQIKD